MRKRRFVPFLVTTLVAILAYAPSAGAASSVGSFEIEGNLVDDSGAGEPIDWLTTPFPANRVDFTDKTKSGDDIFGLGSKELEQSGWECKTGSAPGKDDIKDGSIAIRNFGGKQFMYVKFRRFATNGDAHMDYEFNKLAGGASAGCPNLPARSHGDPLVAFDTENGGATITVRAFEWNAATQNFDETPLGPKGGLWDGAVNIPNTISGEKDGSFGEAALNLSDTIGTIECGEFAKAYMKTRASTAINSALKDRTTPQQAPGLCPKLELTKSADKTKVSPDDKITYTLSYKNTGEANAQNVVIKDTLPAGTTFDSCSPSCTQSGDEISFNVGTVPTGGSGSVTLTVTVLDSAGCEICNVATIQATSISPVSSNQVCIPNTPRPNPAGAHANDSAYGAKVKSTPPLGDGITPALDQTFTPVHSSQTGVGSDSQSDQAQNVNAPADGSVLHADLLRTSSTSTITASPAEARHMSTAEAVNVNVLNGLVRADFVRGVATTAASGSESSFSSTGSEFKNLVVNGAGQSNVKPGTRIDLPEALYGAGSFVKLYERVGSTSRPSAGQLSGGTYAADLTVNMINVHVTDSNPILPGAQAVDVIVSNAVAHSDFPQTTLCVANPKQSVSGDAFIASAMTEPSLVPLTVGAVGIPASGGSDAQALSSVALPDGGSGVTASTSSSQSTGTLSSSASTASSYAQAEDVCVFKTGTVCTVGAQLVRSQSNSEAKNSGAKSDSSGTKLVGLTVAGQSPPADNPPPNTTVTLPGIGFVIFNEQFCDGNVDFALTPACSDGAGHAGLTVRSIHVKVTVPSNPLGLRPGAEVIVAEAHSDATFIR